VSVTMRVYTHARTGTRTHGYSTPEVRASVKRDLKNQ
jgi:hypothetical protein